MIFYQIDNHCWAKATLGSKHQILWKVLLDLLLSLPRSLFSVCESPTRTFFCFSKSLLCSSPRLGFLSSFSAFSVSFPQKLEVQDSGVIVLSFIPIGEIRHPPHRSIPYINNVFWFHYLWLLPKKEIKKKLLIRWEIFSQFYRSKLAK